MAIFTTLINFTAADVDSTEQPQAFPALSLDASGNLIGVIGYGGTSSDGIVYQLDKGADYATFTTLLDDTFGQNLRGPLVADAAGDLFGVTQDGERWATAPCSNSPRPPPVMPRRLRSPPSMAPMDNFRLRA
jgi:hypothetical protein